MTFDKTIPLFALSLLMAGCSVPDYLAEGPVSIVENLPMSQVDTAHKLNKICNDVIASSGALEQHMIKYVNPVADSTLGDKNTIISSILSNIEIVQENINEISSFTPAHALRARASDILLELSNTEAYLRTLEEAVELDDVEKMNTVFKSYTYSISRLKTLSIGM